MQKPIGRILLLSILPLAAQAEVQQGAASAPYEPAWINQTRAPELPASIVTARPFAGPLEHPWGIARLPDGSFLVTERPGRMRLVMSDGTLSEPIAGLPEVDSRDQGGLLDVAVAPDFSQSRVVFWTYAKPMGDGLVATAAGRGRLSDDGTQLIEAADIFVQQPSSADPIHYGSRIVPDDRGHVFITTGEHYNPGERWRAQDPSTSWGKVLRLNADGSVPADNPFVGRAGEAPKLWTLGHRNVQGAAFDSAGQFWTIEHGPMGGDELNQSLPGANYGWAEVSYGLNYEGTPVGTGEPRAKGFAEPNYYWDPVIAPGGMDFYDGALFPDWTGDLLIGSLNPGGLVRLRLDGNRVVGEERLLPELGRVRDVEELPDGSLLLLTDYPDGEIMRITPD